MLKNTLILPESDANLAGQMLQDAIDDLDHVTMMVFGKSDRELKIVRWADQICNKTRISETTNLRRVVWIRKPDIKAVQALLRPILGESSPVVAVLNFHDQLAATLKETDRIDPLALERAFVEGHKVE